ncbi:cytochrome P450 2K1-like [Antedon mediterranea]|uniref:cytochrome P450 2K1-like n=1 Tax=Antedon mediterranea TaxID=105859 RepID=UPI003AF6DD5F
MSEETKKLPGPRGGGLLGSLKEIGDKAHVTWTKWSATYGPIYRVDLGPLGDSVVLSDYNLFKKAFEGDSDVFSGRYVLPIVKKSGSHGSMAWENGEIFEKRRNLMMKVFEKADIDKMTQNEVEAFCDVLKESQQKSSTTVYRMVYEANLNLTIAFCFQRGKRCPYDDETFRERIRLMNNVLEARKNLMAEKGNIFPFLWSTCLYGKFRRIHNEQRTYINQELSVRDVGDIGTVQDLMDGYVAKVDGIDFPAKECIVHIMNTMGATITLKNAMQWLILLITRHPEVQTKIQTEVTSVFGDEVPTMEGIDKVPYTSATIYETLRIACPAAQVVPHMTQADVKFEGYDIKNETVVFGNIWGLHHDTKYWEEPETFNPDRFLNSEGKLDLDKESYVPFGLGKRRCPGETIAKRVMFLYIASIYQRYGFEEVEGHPLPDVNDGVLFAGLHNPPPYKLKIVSRSDDKNNK